MPTVSFIQKLPIKTLKRWLLWGLSAAVSLLFLFNVVLLVSKTKITKIVSSYFPTKVSLMHVYAIRPNEIILKNVSISNNNIEQDHAFLLPKMVIRFPFFASLRSRSVIIEEVVIEQPSVNFNRLGLYLKKHALALKIILDSLPKNNLTVDVDSAKVNMALENILPDFVHTDMLFSVKHPSVQIEGSFLREGQAESRIPLTVLFEGDAQPNEFFINKIDIKGHHINANLWGMVKRNIIDLNGFLIFDLLGREIPKKQKWFSKDSPPSSGQVGQSIYLLDLKSQTALVFPEVIVKFFQFSVNDKFIQGSGNVNFKHIPEFRFEARHATPGKLSEKFTLNHVLFSTEGRLAYHKLFFDSALSLDYQKLVDKVNTPASTHANFDDVEVQFVQPDAHKGSSEAHIKIGHAKVSYTKPGMVQKIEVKKIKAIYAQKENKQSLLTLNAPFYEGDLKGRVWIDPAQGTSKVKTILWVKDAQANQLRETYPHFAKIHGRLDGKIDILNKPEMDVLGELTISDGRLVEFEFFKWLAERFHLSALKDLKFDRATCNFYFNPSGSGLTDISLNSDGVHLGGNFEVNRNRLVTSKIALRFTKDLLMQSPKFTPLLKLFEEDELRFDFQLSGNEGAMNFQWLGSEVKQKIQDRIPDFIERHIERRIDQGLEVEQTETQQQVQEPSSNITVETKTDKIENELFEKGEPE